MTTFQLQTSLTTQVMEFTGETRTAVVCAAYKMARMAGNDTGVDASIVALQSMLADEIELFIDENSELFAVESDDSPMYSVFNDPDRIHDSQ